MGGYIKVIVRFNDGTISADTYGTNALSFWSRHPKTIRGDDSVMRQYTKACTKWNDGDHTYTPSEYGVFAIDFQTKTILSANDYSDGMSWLLQNVRKMASKFGVEGENGYTIFDEMLYFGWVSLLETHQETFEYNGGIFPKRVESTIPPRKIDITGVRANTWDAEIYEKYECPPNMTFDESVAWDNRSVQYTVVFDYPGWTVESVIDRGIEAQDALRSRLRDLGFPFDEANDAAYAKWKGRRLELEREEEEEEEEEDGKDA